MSNKALKSSKRGRPLEKLAKGMIGQCVKKHKLLLNVCKVPSLTRNMNCIHMKSVFQKLKNLGSNGSPRAMQACDTNGEHIARC